MIIFKEVQDINLLNKIKKKIESLRMRGYTQGEIQKIILQKFGITIGKTTIARQIKGIKMTEKGQKRYTTFIKQFRISRGLELAEDAIRTRRLWKIQPMATKKAQESNIRKIPKSAKALSNDKIFIIAHCMFDGSIIYSPKHKTYKIHYINFCKQLRDQFKNAMWKVYKIKLNYNKRNMISFSSKLSVKDLLRYTPSYSTASNSTGVKIPQEIIKSNKEWKKIFLRAFWDDEGSVKYSSERNEYQLIGTCYSSRVLKSLKKLHKQFGIETVIDEKRKQIIIRGRENLFSFMNEINFSRYVKVLKSKRFRGWTKRKLLRIMVKNFDVRFRKRKTFNQKLNTDILLYKMFNIQKKDGLINPRSLENEIGCKSGNLRGTFKRMYDKGYLTKANKNKLANESFLYKLSKRGEFRLNYVLQFLVIGGKNRSS